MLRRQGEIHDLDYTLYGYYWTVQQRQNYARRIYRHRHKCFIKEMYQTFGKNIPLFVALKEACHRARSLDMEVM